MNNKSKLIISCLLFVAGMLTALSVSAQELKGFWAKFEKGFDRWGPIYAVALKGVIDDPVNRVFPSNVYFSELPNGEKSGYYAVNTAKLTAKIGDKKNVIGYEAMEDIGDGWRMYKFDKPLYIRKYDPNVVCDNLILLLNGAEPAMAESNSSNSKTSNNSEGSKYSDKFFFIEYTQPIEEYTLPVKPDFTTPEAAGYTLLNTKTMSIYKYKCDYFAEGVIRAYFGNGDYATFTDEKVFCGGENDTNPGHNAVSIGNWQITSEDGYVVKNEDGVLTITYPNGCKMINRRSKSLKWNVYDPRPKIYIPPLHNDLLEVPSKSEPLKWVKFKMKDEFNSEVVSGYLDGDRLYAITNEGQFLPFMQVYDGIPVPANEKDTIIGVKGVLKTNPHPYNRDTENPLVLDKLTIRYKNGDSIIGTHDFGRPVFLTITGGSIHRNGGILTFKEVNNRIIKTLTFPNGDKYIGDFKPTPYPLPGTCAQTDEFTDAVLSWPELQLWNGTMIKANGSRIEYKEGKTEQQIAAERKADEAKTMAQYNQLCKQFGKKYVDAALVSNPIVGMPEELLKRAFTLKLVDEGRNYKLYRITGWNWKTFKSTLFDSVTLYSIWVSNGRVTDVRHW